MHELRRADILAVFRRPDVRLLRLGGYIVIRVRTRRLTNRLRRAGPKIDSATRNALNDTAFDLRAKTPDFLRDTLDDPTPFTTNKGVARVKKADKRSGRGMYAELFIAPAQARYLSVLEDGGVSEDTIAPARDASRNKFGNVKGSFHRKSASLAKLQSQTITTRSGRRVGKYFLGQPQPGAGVGVWERYAKNNKVRLAATYIKRKRYRAQLGLKNDWNNKYLRQLPKEFRKQRRNPRYKL